eukprot:4053008-Lingulodinium_polyedra.AAC.1
MKLRKLRTLYKVKAGSAKKKKARTVLMGNALKRGEDFDRTFSPTVKHTTLRTVLAVGASIGLEVQGGDVTQ